ncbi:NADP-dependent oxidoreductase [Micromonospora sp. NBC_01796]|uniref:NADP-dependent oxidoreductase n=1 Tax=Micromonospora sp. NBC_01796 TaxID=2975987 RepID=UPI002DDB49C3|nr:NADP-dependent oxidoreductase [Micromonospora sp. NBC_01796]WSA89427.1 NADP-dependent oxidoreductase [Micromonospora sp. NBC_01796]
MRAVGLDEFGGPEVLRVVELPRPEAGPGQIGIRVHAAGVTPGDVLLRSGRIAALMRGVRQPYLPGQEVAGVVDQIGADTATDLRIGDRVMAMVVPIRPDGGGYAEHVVLDANWVGRAPAGTSHAEAATVPMNGLTARMALDQLDLQPGATLAVTGAAGAVGGFVVQLAKHAGLTVYADAKASDVPRVSALGADQVVERGPGVADRFRELAPGGVDGAVDTVGTADLFDAIRDGGGLAWVSGGSTEAPRGIRTGYVYMPDYGGRPDELDDLRRLAETGVLTLRVADTFPPEQAGQAHRLVEAGGVRGRLVIAF